MEIDILIMIVCMASIGAAIGTFTGMVPGIHVNTLATLMLASYVPLSEIISLFFPSGYTAIAICCCITSAAIVHSSIDYVPSVFTGAPSPDDAVSMLPGHRLLNEGKGMSAVRSAAIGSCIGSCVSVLIAIPLQFILMNGLGDYLDSITALILCIAVLLLIINEKDIRRMVLASVVLIISGMLGLACMDLDIPCDGILGNGTLLFPMLSGLFGVPAMLESLKESRVVEQSDNIPYPVGPLPGIKGVLMGCVTGWFPGITATAGTIIGTMFSREKGPEGFIAMTASIGSASSIMMLTTLSVSGTGRSGAMMVVEEIMGEEIIGFLNENFLILLITAAVGAFLAYGLTIQCGKLMCSISSKIDTSKMNAACLLLIVVLVYLFTGPFGLALLAVSALIGYIPIMFGIGRVHLTGCLLIPTLLTYIGTREIVLIGLM